MKFSIEDELGDVAHLLTVADEMILMLDRLANPRDTTVAAALKKARFVAERVRGRLPKGGTK